MIGVCFYWPPIPQALAIWGNLAIAIAYFGIPFYLNKMVIISDGHRMITLKTLFMLFIIACGITHLNECLSAWFPWAAWCPYWIAACIDVTAAISLTTLVVLRFFQRRQVVIIHPVSESSSFHKAALAVSKMNEVYDALMREGEHDGSAR